MSRSKQHPKQLLASFLSTLWVVLTINFLLPRLLPGDPLTAMLDPDSAAYAYEPATRAALQAYYGLDTPLGVQYLRYLNGAVSGDLGQSIRLNQPVGQVIAAHLPYTLLLTLTALTAASLIGVWGGAEAAWRRGSRFDQILVAASIVTSTIPIFFTGAILLILFGVQLDWFPLSGGRTAFATYPTPLEAATDYAVHLFLPALTLTLTLLGSKFLLVRGSMIHILNEDFMLVVRAKGLHPRHIKGRHALPNAILPFVHHLAAHAGFALTGTLFIETLFGYPGMGRLIFESVSARDYPVIQGVFLWVSVLVLSANLAADWLTLRLDPRVREA